MYQYQNGEVKEIVTYEFIDQRTSNHEENDLTTHADLYYDENGNQQVTIEDYNMIADRYEMLWDFLF